MRDRSQLITKLSNSRQSRESYVRSKLNVLIPSQIRALRLRYPLKQTELAELADMKQSRISAVERPGQVQFNLDTLIRIAAALKVALKVEFVTFGEMLDWENGFSQDEFNKVTIDNDTRFLNPAVVFYPLAPRAADTWVTIDAINAMNNPTVGLIGPAGRTTASYSPGATVRSRGLEFFHSDAATVSRDVPLRTPTSTTLLISPPQEMRYYA
jgi:transcriptional regulator with XRE-family HTH domain